jgi:hypothetical protein
MNTSIKQNVLFEMPAERRRSPLLIVATLSLRLGKLHLRTYGSVKSRKDFTQPQLMACIILKAYLKATYRDFCDQLSASSQLREALGLRKVPDYSTLCKFAAKPRIQEVLEGMLGTLAQQMQALDASTCQEAGMDATGIETTGASVHYRTRTGTKRKAYLKLSAVVLFGSLVPAAIALDMGPSNDKRSARNLLPKARDTIRPDVLYADAGYDAEWIHRFCHEDWGVQSVIKPAIHTDTTPGGSYRSAMTEAALKTLGYARRWLVESYISGLKRTTGWFLTSRTLQSMKVETTCKVLAYALRR